MKRLVMMAAAFCATLFAFADEEVSMVEKEITSITVPFGIRSYTPSNKDVVRVEKTSENALRITALKRGRCDLEVRGDMDMTQRFQIVVGDDTARVKQNIDRELERVPEVHTSIIGDSIRVDGEVKSIKKWNYLMKVLKGYPRVRNFAEFTPGDELLAKMKENLVQCGFDVTWEAYSGDPKSWKANCVALTYNKVNRTMNVQAKVYTPEQQAMIKSCIDREKNWIAVDKDTKESKTEFDDEFQIRLNMQVYVAKPIIRLSVAYMAVDEREVDEYGNANVRRGNSPLNLQGTFQTIQNLLHGGGNYGNVATLQANLDVTAGFLKENGISRISQTGYTLIESWDKDGARFKSGGTVFVKVAGADAADLKEIPYGFEIKAKGGMNDDANMAVDFDFGISSVQQTAPDAYDRTEDISKQKIVCPIGRTTLIGGFRKFVDENTLRGLPVLRNTPIFSWFFAADDDNGRDRKLIVLVCPEIVDNTQDAKPDVDKEINIAVQTQAAKPVSEIKEERKPYSGFWSWLNWFMP